MLRGRRAGEACLRLRRASQTRLPANCHCDDRDCDCDDCDYHCDDCDCDYNNKMLFLPWIGNQIVGLAVRGAGTVVPVAGAD